MSYSFFMSFNLSIQELRLIPKVDLHRHLDCSMRWSTMLEIATDLKVQLPQNPTELKKFFLVTEPMINLESVLKKFLIAQKLLASEEILERLAYECCEDAFNDGVRILELRYAPTFIQNGHPHLTFEKIHQAFLRGIALAEKKWPIAVGLICILQRTLEYSKEKLLTNQVMNFAIENKTTFIGVDLADNEDGFEPKKFSPLFEKARAAGLHITIHSGETPSALAPKWIKDSIEYLFAERIGHGVQAIQSAEVMKFLKEKKIPLEVCPYSNFLTQAFKNYADHPLRQLLNEKIMVTLNSDDPGIFGSTLTDEYFIAQNYHQMTDAEFNFCNQIAYQYSFIDEVKKTKVWSNPCANTTQK